MYLGNSQQDNERLVCAPLVAHETTDPCLYSCRNSFIDRQTLLVFPPPFENNNNRCIDSISTDDGQWSRSANIDQLTIKKITLIS